MVAALLVPHGASGQTLEEERDEAESSLARTRDDLDLATARLDELRDEISRVEERLDEAQARLTLVSDEVARVEGEVASITREILSLNEAVRNARGRITTRARTLYMEGSVNTPLLAMLEGQTVEEALDRATLAGHLADSDRLTAESARADRTRFAQLQEQLKAREQVLEDVRAEAAAAEEAVAAELDRAQELRDELASRRGELAGRRDELADEIDRIDRAIAQRERRERERREREAREARAAAAPSEPEPDPEPDPDPEPEPEPAPQPSGRVCPMSPARLVSFWGDPRGSRRHEGIDIAGAHRQTVYAIVSGTWDVMSPGGSAGNWAILHGNDGIDYWYLHLDGHAVGDGTRVSKGQHVAYNGWTGNAVGTVYHIHFEVHPGGGGPIDPYPYLGPAC